MPRILVGFGGAAGRLMSCNQKSFRHRLCPKLSEQPLTRAVVRCGSLVFALTLLIAKTSLALLSSAQAGESMRRKRRENDKVEESQFIPSASEAVRPQTVPFAQKLTCTINEACSFRSVDAVDRRP